MPDTNIGSTSNAGYGSKSFSSEDYIDATTVLGGIHKNIISKNFKGGDITIFMGGAEINLSQADIQGTAATGYHADYGRDQNDCSSQLGSKKPADFRFRKY